MLLNTMAHLGGRVFSAIAGFIVTTFLTLKLGPAAMGIFGIYMVLQGLMGILDGGMATTLNRVIALGTLQTEGDKKHLKLFRTYEIINFGIGILFALAVMFSLPWIVQQWGSQTSENFQLDYIAVFFGLALGLRFVHTLYQNALFGAHQHFAANAVISCFAVLRAILTLIALLCFGANLTVVFMIYALSAALEWLTYIAVCRMRGLWRLRVLPDFSMLKEHAGFMAPISAYTIVTLIMSQFDRVIVGHFVTLEQFGGYSLIASYAAGISALAYAPANVFYPTITQLMHQGDIPAAKKAVRNTLRFILVLSFPVFIWGMFYGDNIGRIIFSNPTVQTMTHGLWTPLFLNYCLAVLTIIPFKILLSGQRAKTLLKINLRMLLIYPALLYASLAYFHYPSGLFALPVLGVISLAQFFWYLSRIGEMQRKFTLDIIFYSLKIATAFALIFGVGHAFFMPAAHSVWLNRLYVFGPLAVFGAAYAYRSILWPLIRSGEISIWPFKA